MAVEKYLKFPLPVLERKHTNIVLKKHYACVHIEGSGPECVSLLYIMLEIHHSGQEPSIYGNYVVSYQMQQSEYKDNFITK